MDRAAEKSQPDLKATLDGFPYLKQILRNIQQVVWVFDLTNDQILYVSPAFETIWGQPCENFYADPLFLIKSTHPEDRVKVLSASLDKNHPFLNQSYRILHADGSLRWIFVYSFLIEEESTNISYQVSVAQDITDQNQIDLTLRKALDRSREQFTLSRRMSLARKPEAVLKTLMSASELRSAQHAFIIFFDVPGAVSPHEFEVIASWSSVSHLTSPTLSETWSESRLFEDLASLELFHAARPVIVGDVSKDARLTPSVRDLLLEKGIKMLVTFPLVALENWLGCLLAFYPQERRFDSLDLRHIKVLVDQATITLYNLKLLEIEAESRHEAERANEIKTRFLAMISHELRTPLTSIKGFTTTLLAKDVTWEPEEQRDFIQTIQQEANRLQELIDHLLDLSRLEAGMLPIVLESHTLQEIIADGLSQFQVMTQQHHLSINLPADLQPVRVDAKRIVQVLVNLVRNAATYAPRGTEISLTASARGGFMQVSVIDQGPGILPGERNRVFQAFQRGIQEENGAGKGAGLGLAICKGLVEAHGGRIWIKKQTTPGTTISFTLPLAARKVRQSDG